jgi:hypothetical protein
MKKVPRLLTILTLLIPACVAQPTSTPPPPTAQPTLAPTEMPTPPTSSGEVPVELVGAIKKDLSLLIGVPIHSMDIVQAEAVTWPDGSLGCPEPGIAYTQALVEGYRVVLNVDGTTYDYHAAQDGRFLLCRQ